MMLAPVCSSLCVTSIHLQMLLQSNSLIENSDQLDWHTLRVTVAAIFLTIPSFTET